MGLEGMLTNLTQVPAGYSVLGFAGEKLCFPDEGCVGIHLARVRLDRTIQRRAHGVCGV